jgi:CHAT domain-containing protein/Flp pilus assembly protein TadD
MAEDMQSYIEMLSQQAIQFHQQSCYDQALNVVEQTCSLANQHFGEAHPISLLCLNNLAMVQHACGKSAQTAEILRHVLDLQQAVLPANHPDRAVALENLASVCLEQNLYQEAEPLLLEAIDIWQSGPDDPESHLASCLNHLALLHEEQDHFDTAIHLYLQAVALWEQVPEEKHHIPNSLDHVALCFLKQDQDEHAIEYSQTALDLRWRALGEHHPDVLANVNELGLLLNGLARLQQTKGRYVEAEHLFHQALTLSQTYFGAEHPHTATSLDGMAGLYRAMGNYTQASTYYHQALEIHQKHLGEDHPYTGISCNNLALFYYEIDEVEKAEQFFTRGLEIARKQKGNEHPDVASALENLGTLYYDEGKYEQARSLLEESQAIKKRILGDHHPDTAAGMNKLALLSHALGETSQAEQLLLQALDIRKQALGELSPAYITNVQNLAWLYAATDRPQEALALKKQALALEESIMSQVFSLASENQRQAYLAILNRFVDSFFSLVFSALPHSQEALQEALELAIRRKSLGIEALTVQQEAVLSGRYPELALKLRELATLRAQIAQHILEGPGEQDSLQYHQQLEKWQQRREHLEIDLARIPEMKLGQTLARLDRHALCQRLPKDSVLIECVRYEVFDFQNLPHQSRSSWKPARYAAFILHADEPEHVRGIDLGEALPLAREVNIFRDIIMEQRSGFAITQAPHAEQLSEQEVLSQAQAETGRRGLQLDTSRLHHTRADLQAGMALRASLFDPLFPALKGKTRLFIAPAGILHWLPFEVLPDEDGRYLIDRYQISYLGTGRDLIRQTMPGSFPSNAPCVIADPDFDLMIPTGSLQQRENRPEPQVQSLRSRMEPFVRLKGTRKEGERVAQLLGVTPLLGEYAVESALKACHSPHILHIATHGFFLSEQPAQNGGRERELSSFAHARAPISSDIDNDLSVNKLDRFAKAHTNTPLFHSGLAFAGANTWNRGETPPLEAEDGIFTAEDVAVSDLRGTALVVLSACDTGLGREIHSGEGMPGLRRAFALAGAKTLVTSLWKIPDHHTQELMSEFYQRILHGQGCAEALREAQLALKTRYPHPYYWGAFICQGNPGPLYKTDQA